MKFLLYLKDNLKDIVEYFLISIIVGLIFLFVFMLANGNFNFIFNVIIDFVNALYNKNPYLFAFGLGFVVATIISIVEIVEFYKKYIEK